MIIVDKHVNNQLNTSLKESATNALTRATDTASGASDSQGTFAPTQLGISAVAPALVMSSRSFNSAMSNIESSIRSFNASSINPRQLTQNIKRGGSKKRRKRSKGLLEGLFDIVIGVLTLPRRFKAISGAIEGAGKTLAFGIEGIILSSVLAIKGVAVLVFSIIVFIAKYLSCIIQFFLTLPFCFVSHIMWCIWRVVYLIFPFTSCMCWYATGYELMPYYEKFFDVLDEADDNFVYPMLGFYLTKFPPSIVKLCYTCNNKVLRLKNVSKDTNPIVRAGKSLGYDMGVRAPRLMRPAKPHMYKTAINVDKIFR